jgi:hypothetical protein
MPDIVFRENWSGIVVTEDGVTMVRGSDTVSTPHSNSTVQEGFLSTPVSVSFNDLQPSDLDKLFYHSFLRTGQHLILQPTDTFQCRTHFDPRWLSSSNSGSSTAKLNDTALQ